MTAPSQIASMLPEPGPWLPLLIFFARVVDVSMGTVRLVCVTRGRRTIAVALSFVEIVIWVLAISAVFAHLGSAVNIVAYAGGYATGVAVGMWIEQKLALGWQVVTLMSRVAGRGVGDLLRKAGWLVTTLHGYGRNGPVSVCLTVAPRKQVPLIIAVARQADPDVVVTVEDVVECGKGASPSTNPGSGVLQVLQRVIRSDLSSRFVGSTAAPVAVASKRAPLGPGLAVPPGRGRGRRIMAGNQ